ncbi:YraN family protein [Actibacterium atlanticum]|nr:YraN family protein [Actibacterium atlanticum]
MSGKQSYLAGMAAESCVGREYERRGLQVLETRWRGQGGEIDLIARDRDEIVFVEVKKSKDFAGAAAKISTQQIERIFMAASEFVERLPMGQLTPMRFDAALVDGMGRVDIREGALGA